MNRWMDPRSWTWLGPDLRIRVINGTTVQEPGSKGISRRLHYSIELPSLRCAEARVTRAKVGDWDVWAPHGKALIPGRMCVVKLSKAAQGKAVRKCRRQNGKNGNVKPDTLEAARYIMVFTTLDRSIPAETIP